MSLKHSTVAASPRPAAVSSYRRALILVTCLFFLWGLSYGLLDVLNKHFQDTLHVSKAQSGLLQSAYFGAYFVIALPAGRQPCHPQFLGGGVGPARPERHRREQSAAATGPPRQRQAGCCTRDELFERDMCKFHTA